MPIGVYPRRTAKERFWEKVVKLDNGCWEWQAFRADGYGRFSYNGIIVRAHRLSFEWARGVIPEGFELDHLCRNRACVNPIHLEVVTNKVNVLRGLGVTAIHSQANHCLKGHLYDETNTYLTPDNRRDCRTCRKEAQQRWKAKQQKRSSIRK